VDVVVTTDQPVSSEHDVGLTDSQRKSKQKQATLPLTKEVPKALLPCPSVNNVNISAKAAKNKSKGKENVESGKAGLIDSQRKSIRLANKPKTNLTMAEQATQLVMKKCGVLEAGKVAAEEDHGRFRTQFVEPTKTDTVGDLSETFGISNIGEASPLGAMVL
jgi:hypothetical protein